MQFGSGLVLEAVGLVWCSLIDEHTTSWFGVVLVWILHHYQIEMRLLVPSKHGAQSQRP